MEVSLSVFGETDRAIYLHPANVPQICPARLDLRSRFFPEMSYFCNIDKDTLLQYVRAFQQF